jgi:hypothetical protein
LDTDLTRFKREIDAEFRWVGVTWDELHEGREAELPSGVAGTLRAVGFDVALALTLLRSLPDGAGTAGFLERFREQLIRFDGYRRESGAPPGKVR